MNRIRLAAVSVGITLFDHAPLLINEAVCVLRAYHACEHPARKRGRQRSQVYFIIDVTCARGKKERKRERERGRGREE